MLHIEQKETRKTFVVKKRHILSVDNSLCFFHLIGQNPFRSWATNATLIDCINAIIQELGVFFSTFLRPTTRGQKLQNQRERDDGAWLSINFKSFRSGKLRADATTHRPACCRSWRERWRRLAGHTWGSYSPWWRCPRLRGQTASRCSRLAEERQTKLQMDGYQSIATK